MGLTGETPNFRASNPNSALIYADDYLGVAGDFGAVINFILTLVNKRAATIVIPNRSIAFATAIDLTNSRSVRITGQALGNPNSVTDWGPNLVWTGARGSGSAVKAIGSTALEWDHVNLSYSDAAYDGNLFSLKSTGGVQETSTAHIHHCRISGTGTARRAASLIELEISQALEIEHVSMDYAVIGITSSLGSSNGVTIGAGCWFDKHFSECAIKARGSNWTIGEVVHECDPTRGVPLTPLLKLGGDTNGLVLRGGLSLDGGNGGGTIIDLDTGGFVAHAVDICMTIAHASGTAIKLSNRPGRTSAVNVHGARLDGMGVGLDLGRADAVSAKGNYINCTTPWTGAEPTRLDIGSNDYNGNDAACGVPVAQDAVAALTPPGSANNALGVIDITCKEDHSHARYGINGADRSTKELYDPDGHYSPSENNPGTTNIYWHAGSSSYRIQNKRAAGTRTYIVRFTGR